MDYRIQMAADCLIVTIAGEYDYLKALICVKTLMSKCAYQQYDAVLIDVRQLSGNADILQIFMYGELTINSKALKNRIIILHCPEQFHDDLLKAILSNKGIAYESTTKEEDARQWLQGSTAGSNDRLPAATIANEE